MMSAGEFWGRVDCVMVREGWSINCVSVNKANKAREMDVNPELFATSEIIRNKRLQREAAKRDADQPAFGVWQDEQFAKRRAEDKAAGFTSD